MKAWKKNSDVWVKYEIKEHKLVYNYQACDGDITKWEITLPVYNKKITHWYPCVGLRDPHDTCEILAISVDI